MLRNLLQQLWLDDGGAIISVEWILFVSILIFGIIPGLVVVRNGIDSAMGNIANILVELSPNFSFAGFGFQGSGGGTNVAAVSGFNYTPALTTTFASYDPGSVSLNGVLVDPNP